MASVFSQASKRISVSSVEYRALEYPLNDSTNRVVRQIGLLHANAVGVSSSATFQIIKEGASFKLKCSVSTLVTLIFA